jgi:hypothetical protein
MPISPVLNQIKSRATGYVGSKFVGVPGQPPDPAQTSAPAPLNRTPGPPTGTPMTNTGVLKPQVQPTQGILPGEMDRNGPAPSPAPYAGPGYVGTPANSNMQGFVQGKLADPTLGTTHKYQGGRYLQQHPGDIGGLLQQPGFEGWKQVGPDKILGPGGSTYDVRNANGAVQWTAISGPAWDKNGIAGVNSLGVNSSMKNDGIKGNYAAANTAAADAAKAAGGSTMGYASSSPGGPAGAGALGGEAGAAGSSFTDQVRARLMAQMDQVGQPVTGNDPAIAAAMEGARLESERGLEQSRKEQAERMYAEGSLNSNALGQGLQQGRERAAGGLAGLKGDLMGREMTARRSQMATLLQQALQSGDNESARALQLKLSQMDNEIRKAEMAQAGQFHDDSYGLQKGQFTYEQDRDAARAKAGLNF